ncbi:MAG TPA: alpha/beta fold hydrolase [Candidatus Saccharimonadales bacterium]|nr:alpha/beta fold hydrolase [Candidatus Saccharimonadales bacterium]
MKNTSDQGINSFIVPINMNGLKGRMLNIAANSKNRMNNEILLVYGHHSCIEQWFEIINTLKKYGNVTVTDLPGFGGMHSLYKINEKPTIDNLADYLASFIKLRYKRRKIKLIGVDFGFAIVTRMLQRYPDIARRVNCLVSVNGFTHRDDFDYERVKKFGYRALSYIGSYRLVSWLLNISILHSGLINKLYGDKNTQKIMQRLSSTYFINPVNIESFLWKVNDTRTHLYTIFYMLNIDNCQKPVDLAVWHVSTNKNQQINQHNLDQHMQVIFSSYSSIKSKSTKKINLSKQKSCDIVIPNKLRKILNSLT